MVTRIITYFAIISLLFSCDSQVSDANDNCPKTFSPLIEFQYLYNNSNVENGTYVDTYEIKYRSDGLMITGYISKIRGEGSYPAIIYNRGGNRNFGTISDYSLENQRNLAANGFVVLSSQLRGNDFSQGRDEYGGKDLNDILQLIKIVRSLSFVSPKKIGVYGVSRGGLNAYQISRLTDDIEAIAVVGAPVDIRKDYINRPEMYTRVHLPIIGDTSKYKGEYDYRSPILWANEINEPVLIMHGSSDDKVYLEHSASLMIDRLDSLNGDFEHKIFEGGNHDLSSHQMVRDSLVANWFNRYLR